MKQPERPVSLADAERITTQHDMLLAEVGYGGKAFMPNAEQRALGVATLYPAGEIPIPILHRAGALRRYKTIGPNTEMFCVTCYTKARAQVEATRAMCGGITVIEALMGRTHCNNQQPREDQA